jgi:hypothetical protein
MVASFNYTFEILSRHLLSVVVAVELKALLGRYEVETFVRFLSHDPFP